MSNNTVISTRLTPQKLRFIDEYIKDLNAKAAAIRAGYSERSAAAQGSKLINEVAVSQAIDRELQARQIRTRIVADQVLRELAILGLSDVTNYDFDENGYVIPREGANPLCMRAVKKVTRRVRRDKNGGETLETELELWDKTGALRMIGKHLGMFVDRKEITGKDGGPIRTEAVQVWKFGDKEITF